MDQDYGKFTQVKAYMDQLNTSANTFVGKFVIVWVDQSFMDLGGGKYQLFHADMGETIEKLNSYPQTDVRTF